MSQPTIVDIHYLRPPDREDIFRQALLVDADDVKVTLAVDLVFEPPMQIEGRVALETGSAAVWFTFPGKWHDIGLFHRADRGFTGIYANILTPPTFETTNRWRTTDLFLDVWLAPGRTMTVLDRDQFDQAVREGIIDQELATGALSELATIVERHRRGEWPPAVVREWSLERALSAAGGPRSESV